MLNYLLAESYAQTLVNNWDVQFVLRRILNLEMYDIMRRVLTCLGRNNQMFFDLIHSALYLCHDFNKDAKQPHGNNNNNDYTNLCKLIQGETGFGLSTSDVTSRTWQHKQELKQHLIFFKCDNKQNENDIFVLIECIYIGDQFNQLINQLKHNGILNKVEIIVSKMKKHEMLSCQGYKTRTTVDKEIKQMELNLSDWYLYFINWADFVQNDPILFVLAVYHAYDNYNNRKIAQFEYATVENTLKLITFGSDSNAYNNNPNVKCNQLSSAIKISNCRQFLTNLRKTPQQQIFKFQSRQVYDAVKWLDQNNKEIFIPPSATIDDEIIVVHHVETYDFGLCTVVQTHDSMPYCFHTFDTFDIIAGISDYAPSLTLDMDTWENEFKLQFDRNDINMNALFGATIEYKTDKQLTFFIYKSIVFDTDMSPNSYRFCPQIPHRIRFSQLQRLPSTITTFGILNVETEHPTSLDTFYPAFANNLKNLNIFMLSGAGLVGTVDVTRLPPNLHGLVLNGNSLSGEIEWCKLPRSVRYVIVHDNALKGKINPSCLPNNLQLKNLIINNNKGLFFTHNSRA